jgi:lysozyme family protein
MNFDAAFTKLIGNEGGYSNNPADPGGETNWGITKRVALANGFTGSMIDLRQDQAKAIYRRLYWDACACESLPESARFDVFDAAVNSGCVQAIKWLQRALGIGDDGVIGNVTFTALQSADASLCARFNGHRLDFMTSLPTWATFGKGWARRIANNLKGESWH